MITMVEAGKSNNSSSKLIQPCISTFFTAQKTNSKVLQIINKEILSKPQTFSNKKFANQSSQKGRKKSGSKVKPQQEANKTVITDITVDKSHQLFSSSVDKEDTKSENTVHCYSPPGDITLNDIGDLGDDSNMKILPEDTAVSVENGILTISLIEVENLKSTSPFSPSKRSGELCDSSSTPKKVKFTFEHTSEKIADSDDDTVNLSDYGLSVSKLEEYSPSFTGKLKLEQSVELITLPEPIKGESGDKYVEDADATIICGLLSTSHICATPVQAFKEEDSGYKKSIAIQTPISSKYCSYSIKGEESLITEDKSDLNLVRCYLKRFMMGLKSKPKIAANLGEDIRVLEILFELSCVYQEICVRLFCRRTKWQRMSKFVSVIEKQFPRDEIITALHNLDELNYIHRDFATEESLETILNHLRLTELKEMAKIWRIKNAKSKQTIIECLVKFVRQQPSLGNQNSEDVLRRHVKTNFNCFCLDTIMNESLFRLQLLHHFTLPKITSMFDYYKYLSDINTGSIKLPKYCVRNVSAFKNSDAFFRYARAIELQFEYNYHKSSTSKSKMRMMEDTADTVFSQLQQLYETESDILTTPVNRSFTAEHVYSKILSQAAVDFTKKPDKVREWLSCMVDHHNGPKRGVWYDRLAMYHQKNEKYLAVAIINKGLSDKDVSRADKITLSIRAASLIKKGIPKDKFSTFINAPSCVNIERVVIEAQPMVTANVKYGRIAYEDDYGIFTVEEIAIHHYTKSKYNRGIHCEGSLIMTLFVALFWDIIYQDIGDVPDPPFISSLQYIPLDLFSTKFYLRRKEAINKRLKDIEDGWSDAEFTERLWEFHYENSHRKSLHDINLSGEIAVEAVECIGRLNLHSILRRFLEDPREYRAGLPDLFVWNNKTKECCFVEVKSHNDKLSIRQKLWLEFLYHINVTVEVCLVNSIGKKVCKTRTKL